MRRKSARRASILHLNGASFGIASPASSKYSRGPLAICSLAPREVVSWGIRGRQIPMWDELKKLLKHFSVYGLGNILGKVAGFLLIPFYTHYLSTSEYGTLELLDLSLSLIMLMLNVWVAAPLMRFYYHYEDAEKKKRVVSTALLAGAFGALTLTLAGLHFAPQLSNLLFESRANTYYLQIIAISFFFSCINSVAWNYLLARQRSSLIVSLNILVLILTLSLNIYLIAFAHLGVLGVLYSGLIGKVLTTCVIGVLTIREVGLGFDFSILAACAGFGAPLIFSNLGAFVLNFSDRFFLQRYSTLSVVGTYALGYKLGFMLSFLLIQPFSMIWSARMYEIDRREDSRELFSKFGGLFCLVLATAALGLSVLAKGTVAILATVDYRAASEVIPLIALAYVFQGMGYYFQSGILIEKKTVYLGLMGLLGGGANILLNFLLIPRYAAMGAAWATVLSFLLMAVLAYVFSQKLHPVPFCFRKLLLPILLGAGAYLASTWVNLPSIWLSTALKALFVPAFLVAVYLLGFFDKSETAQLKSALFALRGRFRRAEAVVLER